MDRLRQHTVQVSARKYWGYLPKTWSAGPLVPKLDSRSLGRCPWFQCPRSGQVCFRSPRETTGQELVPKNKNPYSKEEKPKGAAQRRLLDQPGPQQERVEPKGSSAETARLVLVPQKRRKPKAAQRRLLDPVLVTTKRQLSGDCSTGLGPTRNGENQKQLSGGLLDQFWSHNPKERRRPRRAWSCSQRNQVPRRSVHNSAYTVGYPSNGRQ